MNRDLLSGMTVKEKQFYEDLMKYEDQNFRVLPNVLIKCKNGFYSQIDFVLVTSSGIFVIEYKGKPAKVYGGEYKDWTCYYGHKKEKFHNPILQNDRHVKKLDYALSTSGLHCLEKSVIVFPNDAELDKIDFVDSILHENEVISYIKKFPIVEYDIDLIVKTILSLNITDPIARNAHIENAKKVNLREHVVTIGSTIDVVINILGEPLSISEAEPIILKYEDFSVYFDSNSKVSSLRLS